MAKQTTRNANANPATNAKGAKPKNAPKSAKAAGVPLPPQAVVQVPAQCRQMQKAAKGGYPGWPKRANTGAANRYAMVVAHHGKTYGQLAKAWAKQAAQGAPGIQGYSAGGEIGWCLYHNIPGTATRLVALKQPTPANAGKGASNKAASNKGASNKAQPAPSSAPANPASNGNGGAQ